PRERPEIGLGSIDNVSFAGAVARAKDIDAGLRAGANPRDVRDGFAAKVAAEAEAAKAEAALPTIAEMAERYVAWMIHPKNKGAWKDRYAKTNWLNPVKTHAFPTIGHMKVNEVTPKHIAKLLADMTDKGLSAHKVRSNLKALFSWLRKRGDRDANL